MDSDTTLPFMDFDQNYLQELDDQGILMKFFQGLIVKNGNRQFSLWSIRVAESLIV